MSDYVKCVLTLASYAGAFRFGGRKQAAWPNTVYNTNVPVDKTDPVWNNNNMSRMEWRAFYS